MSVKDAADNVKRKKLSGALLMNLMMIKLHSCYC